MFADSDVRGAAECPARPSCGTNEDTLLDLFTSHYSNQLNVMTCSEQILKSNNNDSCFTLKQLHLHLYKDLQHLMLLFSPHKQMPG